TVCGSTAIRSLFLPLVPLRLRHQAAFESKIFPGVSLHGHRSCSVSLSLRHRVAPTSRVIYRYNTHDYNSCRFPCAHQRRFAPKVCTYIATRPSFPPALPVPWPPYCVCFDQLPDEAQRRHASERTRKDRPGSR
ncbi:unnamed protein product, partial [Ectocarpus sp. 13 AM-2016]